MGKSKPVDFGSLNFARIAHNYLNAKRNGSYTLDDLNSHLDFFNALVREDNQTLPKYKVGLMFVCINPPYWQYAEPVLDGVKNLFLPGHDVEVMCWSDVPKPGSKEAEKLINETPEENKEYVQHHINVLGEPKNITVFETESVEWPYPTLMRYHLFLGQEEYLQKFDYLFYLDLDMRIVNIVGDEILPKEGLMAAAHPMYYVRRNLWPPYEPNQESAAYIPRPGRVVEENGKPIFQPTYAAGGFQGGKRDAFIKAMKAMKDGINQDFNKDYIAIWNDESHYNKYLFENPAEIFLDPSYVYPDSMINEYYQPIWGRSFSPKIITLTKPFTVSKEGGAAAAEMMESMKPLQ